jgi:hypothetical protein
MSEQPQNPTQFKPEAHTIDLVNKTTNRVARYWIDSLSNADLIQATNVRDHSTWVMVKENATEEEAKEWLRGTTNDS